MANFGLGRSDDLDIAALMLQERAKGTAALLPPLRQLVLFLPAGIAAENRRISKRH